MIPRIAALVPMRHASERVPGKNFRDFAGKPLYHRIITSLLDCPLVGEIAIDTDSPVILADAAEHFPRVRRIERPARLGGVKIPMNEVLLHDIGEIEADYYLQTHSTNPLVTGTTIARAVRAFLDSRGKHDSLFSVTRVQSRFWRRSGKAVNHDPDVLVRTQDLEPIFEENSCLYIFSPGVLKERRNRIGRSPLLFEIARAEAVDIDEELDFEIAETLFLKREKARCLGKSS